MSVDTELQMLQIYIIRGWPQNKDNVEHTVQGFWPIMPDLVTIDGVAMKSRQIIIPFH